MAARRDSLAPGGEAQTDRPDAPAADRASDGDPPGRWAALGVLGLAMLLAMTTWFSASVVLAQLRSEWHLSAAVGSLLTIAVQLGFVAGALISAAASLADVVPPRRLMLYGAVGASAANAGLLAVHGAVGAVGLRFATGLFLAGVYPPALKAMATWFRRGRGTALGIMVGALTLGTATPQLVAALGGLRWQVVLVATSLLTLAGGLTAEWLGRDGPFAFSRARFDPRQARNALSNRAVRLASIGYFGHMWELFAMWAWFGTFFAGVLALHHVSVAGWGPRRMAALGAFGAIGVGAAGSWVGGVLSDRWGRAEAAGLAMALSGSTAVTIGFARSLPAWVVLLLGLFWGFWVVADSAQFSTVVTEAADPSYVGTAVTLQLAIGYVLSVVTVWLVPLVVSAGGWSWAFVMLAPGPAVGVAAMARLRHAAPAAGFRPSALGGS